MESRGGRQVRARTGGELLQALDKSVAVTFDDRELVLEAGDSVYFNPMHPHGQKCAGDTPAKFVTIIAE